MPGQTSPVELQRDSGFAIDDHGSAVNRRRLVQAGALAAAAAALPRFGGGVLAAPASTAPTIFYHAQDGTKGGTIVQAPTDADTLNPIFSQQSSAGDVFRLIFDTLINLDADLSLKPGIAESWTVSEDSLTITLKIRAGLSFHDGTPVDAAAVKYNLDKQAEQSFAGIIASTEAPDATTAIVTLTQPYAPILGDFTSPFVGIVSPTAAEAAGDAFGDAPVGSGPFIFKEWVIGDHITVEKNPNYQGNNPLVVNQGAPFIDEIVLRTIAEIQTLRAEFEAGDTNVAEVEGDELNTYTDNPDYQIVKAPRGTGVTVVQFMMQTAEDGTATFKAPFDDVKVRQAVGYALNPDEINLGVVGGQAQINKLPIPYGLLGWSQELADEIGFAYDPEKAKALLDEAGWAANGDGTREKDGKSLDVSLWTNSSTLRQKMCEVIQFQLAQVGINVTIQPIDLGSFLARLTDGEADFYLLQRGGDDPDTLNYTTNSEDSGIRNYQGYNPDFKTLIEQGRATTDPDERVRIYTEAMRMYMADAGLVPLFTFLSTIGLRSAVKDVKFTAYGLPVYNDAYVEQ